MLNEQILYRKKYWKQKAEDEKLAKSLVELNQNPEYVKKVKACSGDVDAMMAAFKEYTGIDKQNRTVKMNRTILCVQHKKAPMAN